MNRINRNDRFHIASLRSRPDQPLRDAVLRADAALRMLIRKVCKRGIIDTGHNYKRTGTGG